MAGPIFKTASEMDRIRKADAIIQEKRIKSFVPEDIKYDDKASFVISRCVRGPQGWVGFFKVDQIITEDRHGVPLKKPFRKMLKSGIDMVVALATIEEALRRRVYK